MPCYHPITAVQPTDGGPLSFPKDEHLYLFNDYRTLQIACGKCHGCMLKRSRDWAIRSIHEAQMHKYNSYITLTLRTEYLTEDRTLDHRWFKRFLRKTRSALRAACINPNTWPDLLFTAKDLPPPAPPGSEGGGDEANYNVKTLLRYARAIKKHDGTPVAATTRYLMCGEYGEDNGRPHYHALLFNLDFRDRLYHKTTPSGSIIYTSRTLEKLWPYGYSSVGDLTFESAAYVSRYIMAKRADGDKNYNILDPDTGQIYSKKKEYNQMSRQSGIGSSWYNKYNADVTAKGKVIARGHENNPPRYYDKLQKKLDNAKLEEIKYNRYVEAQAHGADHSPERLAIQEQVAKAKTKRLYRNKL